MDKILYVGDFVHYNSNKNMISDVIADFSHIVYFKISEHDDKKYNTIYFENDSNHRIDILTKSRLKKYNVLKKSKINEMRDSDILYDLIRSRKRNEKIYVFNFPPIEILKKIHLDNLVDISLCSVIDVFPIVLDCSCIKPSIEILLMILKKHGIIVLLNFFPESFISSLLMDAKNILKERTREIEWTDIEDLSKDERIFNVEKYSENIKKFFDDFFLDDVARSYVERGLNKKILLNRLFHEPDKSKNSGGGWHRDSNDLQFKSLLYLTRVTSQNGCFQFITNSSCKDIGFPKSRTLDDDTRFHDDIIDSVVDNDSLYKIDICGPPGTLFFVDTTYIHRGAPIENGERIALTTYYL